MSNRPHVRGLPVQGDPREAQKSMLGHQVLWAAVRAHMSGEENGFQFMLPKDDDELHFTVTVALDEPDAS